LARVQARVHRVEQRAPDCRGSSPRDDLTKIGTNNRLRRALRTNVARFGLSSPDPAVIGSL